MATYTKQELIEKTVATDEWLSKAIVRLAQMRDSDKIQISREDNDNLNYWFGWVRVKDRHLSGRFRDDAVAFVKRNEITDALWKDTLERRAQLQAQA